MILSILATKGGVGKTTLSTNLAILRSASGANVLLVDGDEQRSALLFTELRTQQLGSAGYSAMAVYGVELRTQILRVAAKYDDLIVDVGGRDSGSLRAALTVADMVLIPVQPRTYDIWSLTDVKPLVMEARQFNPGLRVLVVLSLADVQGQDNESTSRIVDDLELPISSSVICRRKVFANAAAAGLSVVEYRPRDGKAISELTGLYNDIYLISE